MTLAGRALWFAAVYLVLSLGYGWARGTVIDRVLIDFLTVKPAAFWVNQIDSSVSAVASGSRLSAPGGGINVLNGCEGADLLFLVVAALAAAPLDWRARVIGGLAGLAVAYLVNQARVVALFFAARDAPELFATLHGLVLPLLTVGAVAAWFWWFMRRSAMPSLAAARR